MKDLWLWVFEGTGQESSLQSPYYSMVNLSPNDYLSVNIDCPVGLQINGSPHCCLCICDGFLIDPYRILDPPVNNQCSHRGRRGETRDDVMRRNARWEFIEHWITAATGINTSVKSRQVHCYHVLTAVSEAEDGGTDRWKDRWINRVTVRTDRWKGQQMDGQTGL